MKSCGWQGLFSHAPLSWFRPICGRTTRRWWHGWRSSSLKKRARDPLSTRTSNTSAGITSSSRYAGDWSEHVYAATNCSSQNLPAPNEFLFFTLLTKFQPCSSESRSGHGFHSAHDPAHLTYTENGGGAHPVHYGDVSILLIGSLVSLFYPTWPVWVAGAQLRPQPRPGKPGWDPGLKRRLEEPTWGSPGDRQATNELLAMIHQVPCKLF